MNWNHWLVLLKSQFSNSDAIPIIWIISNSGIVKMGPCDTQLHKDVSGLDVQYFVARRKIIRKLVST